MSGVTDLDSTLGRLGLELVESLFRLFLSEALEAVLALRLTGLLGQSSLMLLQFLQDEGAALVLLFPVFVASWGKIFFVTAFLLVFEKTIGQEEADSRANFGPQRPSYNDELRIEAAQATYGKEEGMVAASSTQFEVLGA
ncbi:hypothetical protein HYQ46_011927 [Verticillium longisporum]|nr:hypothetical protein HYQ46_011927 [Verticillium longisporum]